MTKEAQEAMEKLAVRYKGKAFPYFQWKFIIHDERSISFTTFKKYAKLEKVEEKYELSLEAIVDKLNNDTNDDSEECSWYYYELCDGKIYEVQKLYKWN